MKRGGFLKRGSRLNPISEKRRLALKSYVKTWDLVWARCRGRCEVGIDGVCTGTMQHRHHRRRRSQGGPLSALANLVGTCKPCHDWIHKNVAAAQARGLLEMNKEAA